MEDSSKFENTFSFLSCGILCALSFTLWLLRIKKIRDAWTDLENVPGPPTIPLFGNALSLNIENHELLDFTETLIEKWGNVFRVWLFYKPYICIADATVAEKILTSKRCLDKGDDMSVFHPWWGSGLLTAQGDKWKVQRKLLNHTFSRSILLEFMDIFNKESLLLSESLLEFSNTGQSFDFIPFVTTATLNIICETAMGKRLVSNDNDNQEYIEAVKGMYYILLARMTKPWLRPKLIWNLSAYGRKEKRYLQILHGFTDKVIAEKRSDRELQTEKLSNVTKTEVEGIKIKKVFMDYLLDLCDTGHELSDRQIRNEIDTFMAAGHDTVAMLVSWTLFLLATYPEEQIKVQKELDEIFEENARTFVSSFELSKMSYLNMCIKEAMRIYPIVPFNFRKLSEKIDCGDGKYLPSGINVVIMSMFIHKDPLHFPNPHEFRPNRFLAENCLKRHPFAYTPFSKGLRDCIGQKFGMNEAKVILSILLRKYNWTAMDKREDIKLDLDLVIRPRPNNLRFKISKR